MNGLIRRGIKVASKNAITKLAASTLCANITQLSATITETKGWGNQRSKNDVFHV